VGKIRKNQAIFLLILVQSLVSIFLGLTVFFLISHNKIASGVYVDSVYVGGLNKTEASKKIDDSLGADIQNKSLIIKYDNQSIPIKYSDIDASLDSTATADIAYGEGNEEILLNFIRGCFSTKKNVVSPIISFNEGKLREKLDEQLKTLVNKDSKNSFIYLQGNKIIKVPEIIGYKFNIENTVSKIRNEIGSNINTPIILNKNNNFEIQTVIPKVTLKDFNGVNNIIAQTSTEIPVKGNGDSIKQAVTAINNIIIYPVKIGKEEKSIFSFNKRLSALKVVSYQNDEGYNQVASTLYATVLAAGIKQSTITRTPHEATVDYINPGLDACVSSNSEDLKFENTLQNNIVIVAEIKDSKLVISLLGKSSDRSTKINIVSEVQQRYMPTVINVENQDLRPGQKKLISLGKDGLRVNVYSIKTKGKTEVDKKLLYYDQYKSVEAIVQIGPNTDWYNNDDIGK